MRGIEQMKVSLVITNVEGTIEYVNPFFETITGYHKEEVLGKNPRILKSGRQSADFYKQMWDTLTAGKVWHGELQNRRKNGTLYWERATITPILDSNGTITHYIGIKEDINALKSFEEQLQSTQHNLQQLIDSASSYIWSVDTHHRLVYYNKTLQDRLQEQLNITLKPGATHTHLIFEDEHNRNEFKSHYDKALRGEEVSIVLPFTNRKGETIYLDVHMYPIKDKDTDAIEGVACYMQDITKVLEYQRQLELHNRQLQTIAWNQSHVVRAPLSRLLGLINLLSETQPEDKQYEEILGYIRFSAKELDQIIKNIVRLSESTAAFLPEKNAH